MAISRANPHENKYKLRSSGGAVRAVMWIRIKVAPDTELAGYPANRFAGYPVSGQISGIRYPAGYPAEYLKGVTKKTG